MEARTAGQERQHLRTASRIVVLYLLGRPINKYKKNKYPNCEYLGLEGVWEPKLPI